MKTSRAQRKQATIDAQQHESVRQFIGLSDEDKAMALGYWLLRDLRARINIASSALDPEHSREEVIRRVKTIAHDYPQHHLFQFAERFFRPQGKVAELFNDECHAQIEKSTGA